LFLKVTQQAFNHFHYINLDTAMSVCLLEPTGVLDVACGESLLNQIQSKLNIGKCTFYIDFPAAESLDDQGMELLLQGLKTIADTGGKSFLHSLTDEVRSLFVARGLDMVLSILP
jgi:anti-anti-sigma factor